MDVSDDKNVDKVSAAPCNERRNQALGDRGSLGTGTGLR